MPGPEDKPSPYVPSPEGRVTEFPFPEDVEAFGAAAGTSGQRAPAPVRFRRILLFGSAYDGYLLQQAGFTPSAAAEASEGSDRVFIPVSDPQEAVRIVAQGAVDLVLSDLKFSGHDAIELSLDMKKANPKVPLVLLTSNQAFGGPPETWPQRGVFDRIFIWHGDLQILRSILNLFEDWTGAEVEIRGRALRSLLLVEDEPALYSYYLPLVYAEIEARLDDLLPPDATPEEQERRKRDRPRLFLATTYEQAAMVVERYGFSLVGVVTDCQFPLGGLQEPDAGIRLTRYVRKRLRPLPVLLQSRDQSVSEDARGVGAHFVWKNSARFLRELRTFMIDYLGFGEFVFRTPDGVEVARARTIAELAAAMRTVPIASYLYHARQNHMSNWLDLRGEHALALQMRSFRSRDETGRARGVRLVEDVVAQRVTRGGGTV